MAVGEAAGLGACGWAVGYPVMDEEGNVGVGGEVVHLFGGGVGGHDDFGEVVAVGGGGEVGVVHEGDVGDVVVAGGQVEEAGVFEALDYFCWEGVGDAHVGVAGRGFVGEGYLLFHCRSSIGMVCI